MHISDDVIGNVKIDTTNTSTKLASNLYEGILLESKKYQGYIEQSVQTGADKGIDVKERILPMLTSKTLSGEDKIAYRGETYYVVDRKYEILSEIVDKPVDNYSITFFYLGDDLTGHPKIIHGGLLATLLDELTCRLAFQNFHSRKGVTANLNINYRKPCYSNNYVMIKCEVLKKNGKKCQVKGSVFKVVLEDETNFESKENLLTECEVLVIEPKWVHDL